MSKEIIAPEGQVWVCMACGKFTKDRLGNERGWDVSCALNSSLVALEHIEMEDGRVTRILSKQEGDKING